MLITLELPMQRLASTEESWLADRIPGVDDASLERVETDRSTYWRTIPSEVVDTVPCTLAAYSAAAAVPRKGLGLPAQPTQRSSRARVQAT